MLGMLFLLSVFCHRITMLAIGIPTRRRPMWRGPVPRNTAIRPDTRLVSHQSPRPPWWSWTPYKAAGDRALPPAGCPLAWTPPKCMQGLAAGGRWAEGVVGRRLGQPTQRGLCLGGSWKLWRPRASSTPHNLNKPPMWAHSVSGPNSG